MTRLGKVAAILILFLGIGVVSIPAPANATVYEIVSRSHKISGEASVWEEWVDGYDEYGYEIFGTHSDSKQFSRTSTSSNLADNVQVSGVSSGISAYASATSDLSSNSTGFDAHVYAASMASHWAGDSYTDANSLSELNITFMVDDISRWVFWAESYQGWISLIDLTSGNVLFDINYECAILDKYLTLTPYHLYGLAVSASSDVGNDSYVNFQGSAVPEAATILLVGSGLVGIAVSRRKLKK